MVSVIWKFIEFILLISYVFAFRCGSNSPSKVVAYNAVMAACEKGRNYPAARHVLAEFDRYVRQPQTSQTDADGTDASRCHCHVAEALDPDMV